MATHVAWLRGSALVKQTTKGSPVLPAQGRCIGRRAPLESTAWHPLASLWGRFASASCSDMLACSREVVSKGDGFPRGNQRTRIFQIDQAVSESGQSFEKSSSLRTASRRPWGNVWHMPLPSTWNPPEGPLWRKMVLLNPSQVHVCGGGKFWGTDLLFLCNCPSGPSEV